MLRSLTVLTVTQTRMLLRNRITLVTSLGIGLISMLLFGALFGSGGSDQLRLGIVDEDRQAASIQLVEGLKGLEALDITEGEHDAELQALAAGERRAVLVIGAGFQERLAARDATIQAFYDKSNPVTSAIARSAIQNIVAGLNRSLQASGPDPVKLEESEVEAERIRTIDFMTPGLVGMVIMWANLFVGTRLVEWRQKGVLRRLAVTGLRPIELLASQAAAHLLFSLGQAIVLLLTAFVVFRVTVKGNYGLLAFVVIVGTLCMLAVGYLLGSMPRDADSAAGVTMLVSFPMMFLGGSYFPTDGAPAFLQPLIQALPLTYLNHALRTVMMSGGGLADMQLDLLVLAGWTVGALLVATRLLRWD